MTYFLLAALSRCRARKPPRSPSTIFMNQVQTDGQMDLVAVPNEALASKLEKRGFVRVKSLAYLLSGEAVGSFPQPSGGRV